MGLQTSRARPGCSPGLDRDSHPGAAAALCSQNDHDGDGKQGSVLTIATDLKY